MKIIISDTEMLNNWRNKKSVIYKNRDFNFLKYAETVCKELIGEESIQILDKLGIDKFETIFVGGKPFNYYSRHISRKKISSANKNELQNIFLVYLVLKNKSIFVSRLIKDEDFYKFMPPELVHFELPDNFKKKKLGLGEYKNNKRIDRQIHKISSYLFDYNLKAIKNNILSAENDFNFILKFNTEMFYNNIIYKNNAISSETVISLYENKKYTHILDLSIESERNAFISLYGIAFKELTLLDFYSIDGIFSLQPDREKDTRKQISSQEVLNLIISDDKDEINKVVQIMAKALINLPLPYVNLSDYKSIKRNFSLYIGISNIGQAFSRIILGEVSDEINTAIQISQKLIKYADIIEFYKNLTGSKNQSSNPYYKSVNQFSEYLKDKKSAYSLLNN